MKVQYSKHHLQLMNSIESNNSFQLQDVNSSQLNERRALITEQDAAYDQSLAMDQKKVREERENHAEEERLEQLRRIRLSRVETEILLEDEHVVIAVRHPDLKMQTRFLKPSSYMSAVYDWIGSLSCHPEHFQLYDYNRIPVMPDQRVATGVYNLNAIATPLPMSPSREVWGYGVWNK